MWSKKEKLALFAILLALAVFSRFIPHLWNATFVNAGTLLVASRLGFKKLVIVFPLLALFVSDLFLGFYNLAVLLVVYASFAFVGLIGIWLHSRRNSLSSAILAAFFASTFFFISTNAAVWAFTDLYNSSLNGLLDSLLAGLPFYRNMLVFDILYTLSGFLAFDLLEKRVFKKRGAWNLSH